MLTAGFISRSTTVILDSDEIVDAVACYTDCFGINGDVDGDGKVTVADAILVARAMPSAPANFPMKAMLFSLQISTVTGLSISLMQPLIARAALGLN